jgi:hypothetical protein
MANEPKTRKDLETAVILKAWKDDAFRKELLSNPKAALAKLTGQPLPDDVQVVVHEETAKTFHLCLPATPATVTELDDQELEQVAGGGGAKPKTQCGAWCACAGSGSLQCAG